MEQKKLGFGWMRLPVLQDGEIDMEQVKQMADLFLENGFTYLDTSFAYHGGKSEAAVREAVVRRHPRDSFTVATKFPTFAVHSEDEVEGIFAQQLQNLGTDYVDYYLLHTLNTKFYNGVDGKGGVVKTCHLFEHARKWKAEGKIRHLGFSFHDNAELLDQILTENPDVEFVQIIVNYFDWESYFIQPKACYDVIRRHGKQVVVMEPVKGGVLADHAAQALRYAAGKDGVLDGALRHVQPGADGAEHRHHARFYAADGGGGSAASAKREGDQGAGAAPYERLYEVRKDQVPRHPRGGDSGRLQRLSGTAEPVLRGRAELSAQRAAKAGRHRH